MPAGEWAIYDRMAKQVSCLSCAGGAASADHGHHARNATDTGPAPDPHEVALLDQDAVESGIAGASARREYERRSVRREERIRTAHPKLGGLILALSDEPQQIKSWAQGAPGEEILGKRLDGLAEHGVLLLHDRRIPPGRANIDHIAIGSAGVFVIDAKRYKGKRPTLRIEGGILRPRTETLLVGGRDCSKLVAGITKQVEIVRAALTAEEFATVPITGVLCFVEADWPMFGGSFTTGGIDVLWPAKAAEKITAAGLIGDDQKTALHRCLATSFLPA
jgi:hypothetical protein